MFNRFTAFKFLRRVGAKPLFWLGGPLLLYVWAVPGPFVFDDLNLLRKTDRYIQGKRDRLDLFRFAPTDEDWLAMRSRGTYPWWAPDDYRIDFQRPIAEWSFWLDVKCFGDSPIGPRIESLAWFAIALLLVHRLFRFAEADPLRAGLATFFLGISQCLAQPVAFISNRSDLFVLIGVAIAGAAYFRLTLRPTIATAVVGIVGYVFALLSKEPAVAFVAVVVAHAFIAPRLIKTAPTSRAQRGYAIAVAVVAIAYLAWYFHTSQNVGGSFDTTRIVGIGQKLLLYATVWAVGLPIALLPLAPGEVAIIVTAVGATCWLAIAWIIQRQWRERRPGVLFFSLWALAFIAPALLTIPESRALSIATVGWAWLLAGLLMPKESADRDVRAQSIWTRQWFLATNGIVSVCCGVGTIVTVTHVERQARNHLSQIVQSLHPPLQNGDTLVIREAESPFELICAGDRLGIVAHRSDVNAVYLTLHGADAKVSRIAPRELMIRGKAPELFDTASHKLTLGAGYVPHLGDTFDLSDFTIEVAELNDAGEVTALKLTIHDDVDLKRIRTYPDNLFGE